MPTQMSLPAVISKVAALVVLTYMALAPMLASRGDGLDAGSLFQLDSADLVIPTLVSGSTRSHVQRIYVYNQGRVASPVSTLGITWSQGRQSKLFAYPIQPLAPGEGIWIPVDLGEYSPFQPGTHLRYKADYCQVVCESNEANNEVVKDNPPGVGRWREHSPGR